MNQEAKHDKGKPKYHLIEPEVTEQLAKVLTFGADKYGTYSWKKIDDPNNRYYSAFMRHIEADRMGEDYDEESGLLHLSHALCNLHFLLFNKIKNHEKNNQHRRSQ